MNCVDGTPCSRMAIEWPPKAWTLPAGQRVHVAACCVVCGVKRPGTVLALTDDPARERWDIGTLALDPSREELELWSRTQRVARASAAV